MGSTVRSYPLISSDSHVVEPPDLWAKGIERKFIDRAPRVVQIGSTNWWYADKDTKVGPAIGGQAGHRDRPDEITAEGAFEDMVPRGAYDPAARIDEMKVDGVVGEVVYPTAGLFIFGKVEDTELLAACLRTYNNWVAEFCKPHPGQLKGIAMISLDDIGEAVKELERTAKLGLAGAMIPCAIGGELGYGDPSLEPFWAAAQDSQMGLSLHVVSNRGGAIPPQAAQDEDIGSTAFIEWKVNADQWVRKTLMEMIFSGVFERYPSLKVLSVEHEGSWVPYFLQSIDGVYDLRPKNATYRFKNAMVPSDFFRRNVLVCFQEDNAAIQMRHLIGIDKLMWSSDYPHSESTWPKSHEFLDRIMDGVSEAERTRMTYGNAADLYNFSPPATT